MTTPKSNDIEVGSGNVFEDLGFKHPEEEQAKAELARQINVIIKQRRWKQKEAAKRLDLTQPKISLLSRGQLKNFSLEKLMNLLNLLNRDIEIVIQQRKKASRKPGHIIVKYVHA